MLLLESVMPVWASFGCQIQVHKQAQIAKALESSGKEANCGIFELMRQ